MKIVYCASTIFRDGGIQTSTIAKANALANIDGNKLWIVVTDNKGEPVLPIDEKVQLVDLDVNYFDCKQKWRVLQSIDVLKKKRLHKKKMRECLKIINPDVVISLGLQDKFFLPSLRTRKEQIFIREIAYVSNYKSLLAQGWYEKLFAWAGEFLDYHFFIHRYDKIILLTEEDRLLHWKDSSKVTIIPYPIIIRHSQRASLNEKVVVTAGRLVYQKNYSSLIRSWKIVHSKHPDWNLNIWGQGELKSRLEKQIEDCNLRRSVSLMGITPDLISRFAESSIFVSSSVLEGLPLVMLYALSCGLPIVSYDYPTGPKDTITDGQDGFLIKAGDESAMADRICYLIEHERERKEMGVAALEKSKQYTMDIIMDKWMTLFQDLLDKKKN
jgi:glycosyltransferase involved in cell wall biosynthesis